MRWRSLAAGWLLAAAVPSPAQDIPAIPSEVIAVVDEYNAILDPLLGFAVGELQGPPDLQPGLEKAQALLESDDPNLSLLREFLSLKLEEGSLAPLIRVLLQGFRNTPEAGRLSGLYEEAGDPRALSALLRGLVVREELFRLMFQSPGIRPAVFPLSSLEGLGPPQSETVLGERRWRETEMRLTRGRIEEYARQLGSDALTEELLAISRRRLEIQERDFKEWEASLENREPREFEVFRMSDESGRPVYRGVGEFDPYSEDFRESRSPYPGSDFETEDRIYLANGVVIKAVLCMNTDPKLYIQYPDGGSDVFYPSLGCHGRYMLNDREPYTPLKNVSPEDLVEIRRFFRYAR